MAPWIVIGIFALVGLIGWGVGGLVAGGVIGYVATIVFGLVLNLISGGVIPRKARRTAAINFIQRYPDILLEVFPRVEGAELLKEVEAAVESIFRRAIGENKGITAIDYTRDQIRAAAQKMIDEETDPARKRFLTELEMQIETDLYI